MPALLVACAVHPDRPLVPLTLVHQLRRLLPRFDVRYPPYAQPAALARRQAKPPWSRERRAAALSGGAAQDTRWVEGCAALLVPEWDPLFLPAVQRAVAAGIPVIAAAVSPEDQRLPGVEYVPSAPAAEELPERYAERLNRLITPRRRRGIAPAAAAARAGGPPQGAAATYYGDAVALSAAGAYYGVAPAYAASAAYYGNTEALAASAAYYGDFETLAASAAYYGDERALAAGTAYYESALADAATAGYYGAAQASSALAPGARRAANSPPAFGASAQRMRLRRAWEPLSPRWEEPGAASLGIGVITCNRLEKVRWCVEALLAHTHTPFHLVIADDGSADGTAAWARESGIPVVTGSNRGVAWNKNRALYWLMHQTRCHRILLLEDDVYPVRAGWEQGWLEALEHFHHLNYSPEGAVRGERLLALHHRYPALNWTGGPLMAMTRAAVEQVGYLDIRFRGYGAEHVEYSQRCQRAGLTPAPGFVTLRDGSLSGHPALFRTAVRGPERERNLALRTRLAGESIWRPAARTGEEQLSLQAEQQVAGARARLRTGPTRRSVP